MKIASFPQGNLTKAGSVTGAKCQGMSCKRNKMMHCRASDAIMVHAYIRSRQTLGINSNQVKLTIEVQR
jgi:DUF1680 family protein